MPFKKGKSGNPRGKLKGTLSKTNVEIKEVIQKMVNWIDDPERFSKIMLDVAESKPEVLINFLAKVAPKDINLNTDNLTPNPMLEQMRAIRQELEDKRKPKIIEVKAENG